MDMTVFLNQKRANVCEHTTKMVSLEFLKGATKGLQEEWMEGNLKGNYLKLIPELCLEDRTCLPIRSVLSQELDVLCYKSIPIIYL